MPGRSAGAVALAPASAMYRFVAHTADLGLRVTAPSLEELFADAAAGLTAVIVADPSRIRPRETEAFAVSGADPSWLLVDWLAEVLAAFELRRMLFAEFAVTVGRDGLRAVARGERHDPARHALVHEVKAVTQHGLDVRRTATGWEATVILDV